MGLNVRVYDLSNLSTSDLFRHGTFAEAPSVVRSIGMQLSEPRVGDRPDMAGQAQSFIDPLAAAPAQAPAGPAVAAEPLLAPGPTP